jgi:hypothetical protein
MLARAMLRTTLSGSDGELIVDGCGDDYGVNFTLNSGVNFTPLQNYRGEVYPGTICGVKFTSLKKMSEVNFTPIPFVG